MEKEPQSQEYTMSLSETIETLEGLDTQYKDQIPTEMLSGESEDREWKVRRNWWQGAVATLFVAKEHLDPQKHAELRTKIDQFNKEYTDGTFATRGKTLESDIVRVNEIIREVVRVLKNL